MRHGTFACPTVTKQAAGAPAIGLWEPSVSMLVTEALKGLGYTAIEVVGGRAGR